MLFNSIQFAVFFPVVTLLYFLLPHRLRWGLLLAASCLFYVAFIPAYILILVVTISIDYAAAIWIENSAGARRKYFLLVSIVSTCLVLLIFKYYNFFTVNTNAVARMLGWHYSIPLLNLILPIGLSFHTFQSLSYVIEVYRGAQKAERHFGIYSLYVMFYPQLVAGPIERPQNLLHQFREEKRFSYENLTQGLELMAWGFFKKVVIADRLALYTNEVYSSPLHYSASVLSLATVAFAYQIYCDFSGYSDIAIGSARVMGFDLMKNFDVPYFSQSIGEFWRRWHISLSTWFRDYVYVPLGGSRVSRLCLYRNLMITFIVSGLWHGANWTFIVWGALNGTYLVAGECIKRIVPAWKGSRISAGGVTVRIARTLRTFALICLSWIFFRSNSVSDAWHILGRLAADWSTGLHRVEAFSSFDAVVVILAILALECVQILRATSDSIRAAWQWPVYVRWPAYYALLASIVVFGVFERAQFIYFQF